MGYQTLTPFGRTVDRAIVARMATLSGTDGPAPSHPDKWTLLRDVATARVRLGISDRQISVLQALLSFRKGSELKPDETDDAATMIVHPSNATLSDRLNGMPDSTLRRHIAALVAAGLISRRDSPNGKRYVRRYRDGERDAFGLDLAPLAYRAAEIAALADEVRTEEDCLDRLRRTVSLMRRDLAGLVEYGSTARPDLDLWSDLLAVAVDVAKRLRRRPDLIDLEAARNLLDRALCSARDILEPEEVSGTDRHPGRHHQNSKPDLPDLELRREPAKAEAVGPDLMDAPVEAEHRSSPAMPLPVVISACPTVLDYTTAPIRHWHDLVAAAERIRPMMGISPSAWSEACEAMGVEEAAVTVVGILERFEKISSPGGYLRSLSAKASLGKFSTGPMIMSLLRSAA
ncbi:plasmid replication protein RepC [Jannaschia aquimarina]|nr:plasmid replication protein RepC [Jannaschia aquimarina]